MCVTLSKLRQTRGFHYKENRKHWSNTDKSLKTSDPDLSKAGNSSGCSEINCYVCTGLPNERELHFPCTVTGQCKWQHPACRQESPFSEPLAFRTKLSYRQDQETSKFNLWQTSVTAAFILFAREFRFLYLRLGGAVCYLKHKYQAPISVRLWWRPQKGIPWSTRHSKACHWN